MDKKERSFYCGLVRKGEVTRLEILEAALALASRVGLSGLSIGALAEALGMSKSGLFAHFRSKEALGLAVVDHAGARFVERVVRPTVRAPRGIARIRALVDNWLGWYEGDVPESGCFFAAAAIELDDRPGSLRDRVLGQQRDFLAFMATVVRTAMAEQELRADLDVEQFVQEIFGVALGAHHYRRFLGDPLARSRARKALEGLIERARAPSAPG